MPTIITIIFTLSTSTYYVGCIWQKAQCSGLAYVCMPSRDSPWAAYYAASAHFSRTIRMPDVHVKTFSVH